MGIWSFASSTVPDPDGRKRDEVNAESVERVLADPGGGRLDRPRSGGALAARWRQGAADACSGSTLTPTPRRTSSTTSSTRTCGGFLRRELDFYLKNEVMHLDDIDQDGKSAPDVERYLDKLRAIRRVGHKIIDFPRPARGLPEAALAEEEVRGRDALVCHARPRAGGALRGDRGERPPARGVGPAVRHRRDHWRHGRARLLRAADRVDFLRANPYLVVDTSLFDAAPFVERLLASIDDLDESTDGLLAPQRELPGTEPAQCALPSAGAVHLHRSTVQHCCHGRIPYKNEYEHSSWLSMHQGPNRRSSLALR